MSTMFSRSIWIALVISIGLGSKLVAGDMIYGFGKPATEKEIAAIDLDVRFDGIGLPDGQGTAAEGEKIYQAQCAGCHGTNLEGNQGRSNHA